MNTLREISKSMRWLQDKVLSQDGELVDDDFEMIVEVEESTENKVDAIVHVLDVMDRREDWMKEEVARLQGEMKLIQANRKSLKNYMAYALNSMGLTNIVTRFHRVFVRKTPERFEYDQHDKLLETIDERCIVTQEVRKVSKTRAKEIYEQTGTVPRGFEIVRGLTTSIK